MIHVSYNFSLRSGGWGFGESVALLPPPKSMDDLVHLRRAILENAQQDNPDIASTSIITWTKMD